MVQAQVHRHCVPLDTVVQILLLPQSYARQERLLPPVKHLVHLALKVHILLLPARLHAQLAPPVHILIQQVKHPVLPVRQAHILDRARQPVHHVDLANILLPARHHVQYVLLEHTLLDLQAAYAHPTHSDTILVLNQAHKPFARQAHTALLWPARLYHAQEDFSDQVQAFLEVHVMAPALLEPIVIMDFQHPCPARLQPKHIYICV